MMEEMSVSMPSISNTAALPCNFDGPNPGEYVLRADDFHFNDLEYNPSANVVSNNPISEDLRAALSGEILFSAGEVLEDDFTDSLHDAIKAMELLEHDPAWWPENNEAPAPPTDWDEPSQFDEPFDPGQCHSVLVLSTLLAHSALPSQIAHWSPYKTKSSRSLGAQCSMKIRSFRIRMKRQVYTNFSAVDFIPESSYGMM